MSKQFTQHQKILGYMIKRRELNEWFFPYDFMPPRMTLDYIYFVGYEASARLTELATTYPDMIETEQAGKYKKRRIKWDTIDKWLPHLSKDLRYMFHRSGMTATTAEPTQTAPIHIPVQEPEAIPTMTSKMKYKGAGHNKGLKDGDVYDLKIQRLKVGYPVVVVSPYPITYPDLKAFQKDWSAA